MAMKFWQLKSIVGRTHMEIVLRVAEKRRVWRRYSENVGSHERSILDEVLDDYFVLDVLAEWPVWLFAGPDAWLRSTGRTAGNRRVRALRAYKVIGGERLEDVFEYGSSALSGDEFSALIEGSSEGH